MSNKVGVEYFVHISSLGTRPNAVSRYHQSKWKAEQSVVSSGIPYTIFRPSVVFGPDDEFINMLARMIQYMPVTPLIDSGGAKMQPVYVGDLPAVPWIAWKIPRLKIKFLKSEDRTDLPWKKSWI